MIRQLKLLLAVKFLDWALSLAGDDLDDDGLRSVIQLCAAFGRMQ
jgi:hypothetical protein